MNWLQSIIAVALIAGAIYGWVVFHRKFRSDDDTPLRGAMKRKTRNDQTGNELEAFITAYRDGKIDPIILAGGEDAVDSALGSVRPGALADNGDSSAAAAAAGSSVSGGEAGAETPVAGMLLRPEVKLAYLTFRSGLRDHHVFPNVRLNDLGFGTTVGTVDLLVCDPQFNYVAAIDVYTDEPPQEIAKWTFLRRAGLKYLTFGVKTMPKPAQLRELVYGKNKNDSSDSGDSNEA